MTRKPTDRLSATQAAEKLRSILLKLRPTGVKGFEGLVREVIGAITDLPFRLRRSGDQDAVDAVAVVGERRSVLEAKLYRKAAGMGRHILATLASCASAAVRPDLVIFAATVEIDADLQARARKLAEQSALEVVLLDWAPELPDLALVLAAEAELLPRFLYRLQRYKTSREAAESIATLQSSPDFAKQRDALLSQLRSATHLFETVLRDCTRWHEAAMAERSSALERYGQAMCPLGPESERVITRETLLRELDEAADERTPVRNTQTGSSHVNAAPVVVLGEEGVGKTWLVAQWWLTRFRHSSLLLFMPSRRFRSEGGRPEDILTECLMSVLDRNRVRSSELTKAWRQRVTSEAFQRVANGRVLVVVDGLNETPDADWPAILSAAWRFTIGFRGRLLVTTRPAFWRRREREMNQVDWTNPVPVNVKGFSAAEVAQVCSLAHRDTTTIPPMLLERLNNPRVLSLALRLFSKLRREADLGIDRLLYAYWGQRQADRPDLASVDRDQDVFLRGLARHAEQFHQQRLEAARSGRGELNIDAVGFDIDDLRQRFRGLDRYNRYDSPAANVLIGEIREGRFFVDDPLEPASGYVFRKESLAFALGLYLVVDLMGEVKARRSEVTLERLHERLAVLLEPVLDFDQTADQLMAAVTIACRDPKVVTEVQTVLLEQLFDLRNRPMQLRFAVSALAVESPEPFCRVAQRAVERRDPQRLDSWLLAALRYMASAGAGLDAVRSWLVAPLEEEVHGRDATASDAPALDAGQASREERLAALIMVGQGLTPLVEALYQWALLSTPQLGDRRLGSGRRSVPFAHTPVAYLLRFNDADPESLTAALLSLERRIADRNEDLNPEAMGALFDLIGDPKALELAQTRSPGIADRLDPSEEVPVPDWLLAYDPHRPTSVIREMLEKHRYNLANSLDPGGPPGDEVWALAARSDSPTYVQLAQSAFRAIWSDDSKLPQVRSPAESLATVALNATAALATDEPLSEEAIKALFSVAEGKSSRSREAIERVERTRETLMALGSESAYADILFAAGLGERGGTEGDRDTVLAPHFWYPTVSGAFSESCVREFLTYLDPHGPPPSGHLYEVLRALQWLSLERPREGNPDDLLRGLLIAHARTGALRSKLLPVGMKLYGLELALGFAESGWTYAGERDAPVGRQLSTFLARTLAGPIPLEQLVSIICDLDLAVAAEGVSEAELAELSGLIEQKLKEDPAAELTAPSSVGATRLVRVGSRWIAERVKWWHKASKAMFEGFSPSMDVLTAALLAAAESPIPGAADYVSTLLRLTPTTRSGRSLILVKPALAVAASEPERQTVLLDQLVLGITEDCVLAELVREARTMPPSITQMLRAYARTLYASGRTVRMAYALMLDFLLSDASTPRQLSAPAGRGYLFNIDRHLRLIQRTHEEACYWATKRWVDKDPACEYLAMTRRDSPLTWEPPATGTVNKLDELFLFRFRDKARQWGYDTLLGSRRTPRWVTAVRPDF